MLDAEIGKSLHECGGAGHREKVASLLSKVAPDDSKPWELALCLDGAPRTLAFRSRPLTDGLVALTGSLVPEDYGQALMQG